ncbi:MAG: hypothetical protein ACKO3W_08465 [bacterium]
MNGTPATPPSSSERTEPLSPRAGKPDASSDAARAPIGSDLLERDLKEHDLFEGAPKPHSPFVQFVFIFTGTLLILVGIALGPVPVIPGFPLVLAGILLLAASSGGVRRSINRVERWLPANARSLLRRALGRRARKADEDRPSDDDGNTPTRSER